MRLARHPLHQLEWKKSAVAAAALLVLLAGPCHGVVASVRAMPVGLLAVIGSFLLFGFRTVAALTRRHWHKHETDLPSPTKPTKGATHDLF